MLQLRKREFLQPIQGLVRGFASLNKPINADSKHLLGNISILFRAGKNGVISLFESQDLLIYAFGRHLFNRAELLGKGLYPVLLQQPT